MSDEVRQLRLKYDGLRRHVTSLKARNNRLEERIGHARGVARNEQLTEAERIERLKTMLEWEPRR